MVEEEEPRSLAASAMVSVNKPRRQLQRRLVEEEAVSERRKEESLLVLESTNFPIGLTAGLLWARIQNNAILCHVSSPSNHNMATYLI